MTLASSHQAVFVLGFTYPVLVIRYHKTSASTLELAMSIAASAPGKTLGQIARESNEPLHRLLYVVHSRGIRESCRVGRLRLYDDEAAERIKQALAVTKRGPY